MSLQDERILILTSTRRDSESTHRILEAAHLHPLVCSDIGCVLEEIRAGVGVLLLAKEVLVGTHFDRLVEELARQESWSDLPIVVLASAGDLTEGNEQTTRVLKRLRNCTILERPIRVATLVSVLEAAITNRRRQYEVRKLLHELTEARTEAERANRTKSEFLANMSHEIRTPLGVMLGFADLALDESATAEERKSFFASVKRNGQVLLELVNDILDLAKVESGRIATESIDTSVPEIARDVASGLAPAAVSKGIALHVNIQREFPGSIRTDPTRLRQILLNVAGNAVKFTKSGSVTIDVAYSNLEFGRVNVVITVTDTGMGISDTQKAKLFSPFSQADSSMTREFGGTGLGLVLSRNLAQALGGDLKLLHSAPGRGSIFEIGFAADVSNGIAEVAPPPREEVRSIHGLRILIAEDSADNQAIVSRVLTMAGAHVDIANNGIEAVGKAETAHYDVILMDIQMPVLDGNQATRRLREAGYAKPIVALTANALKGEKEFALAHGFDDYITKPIQRRELFDSLGRFAQPRP